MEVEVKKKVEIEFSVEDDTLFAEVTDENGETVVELEEVGKFVTGDSGKVKFVRSEISDTLRDYLATNDNDKLLVS